MIFDSAATRIPSIPLLALQFINVGYPKSHVGRSRIVIQLETN